LRVGAEAGRGPGLSPQPAHSLQGLSC
jgi:hypothetical protein